MAAQLFGPASGRPPREPARSPLVILLVCVLTLLTTPFWRIPGGQDGVLWLLPHWADMSLFYSTLLGLLVCVAIRWGWQLPPTAEPLLAACRTADRLHASESAAEGAQPVAPSKGATPPFGTLRARPCASGSAAESAACTTVAGRGGVCLTPPQHPGQHHAEARAVETLVEIVEAPPPRTLAPATAAWAT